MFVRMLILFLIAKKLKHYKCPNNLINYLFICMIEYYSAYKNMFLKGHLMTLENAHIIYNGKKIG